MTDSVGMANTPKYTVPGRTSKGAPVPVVANAATAGETRLSPRVEALRKLVAAGHYQVSARYLAHRIMRAAGLQLQ